MEKHILGLILGTITFVSSVNFLPHMARQLGRFEARIDLLQGKRRFKRCIDFCIQEGPLREWESTLALEFDTEIVVVPPCLEDTANYEQMRGYNIRQSEELMRVYGNARVEEEGRKSYQRYLLKLEVEEK